MPADEPHPANLLGMLPEDLVAHLATHQVSVQPCDARRMLAQVISQGATDPAPPKPLAKRILEACQKLFPHLGCPYTRVKLLPANPIKVPGGAPVRRY